MSGSIYGQLTSTLEWGPLRAGDIDTRTKNFGPDLNQQDTRDTIASVKSVVITRLDGALMGGSDLALQSQPTVDATQLMVGLWLGGGIGGVGYNVSISVMTTAGRTLVRDTPILVDAILG